jgi:predicted GIY-YIG superfamily endonuclease
MMNPAPPLWYYVYLLRSKKNTKMYIGCMSDIEKSTLFQGGAG